MINYEPASDEHKVKDLGSLNGVSKMPLVSDNEPIGYVSIPLKLLIPTQLTFTTVYYISLHKRFLISDLISCGMCHASCVIVSVSASA